MMKIIVFCLLNCTQISTRPPNTNHGLVILSKLRSVFQDSSDVFLRRNVLFKYRLCRHKIVCKMDASKLIYFRLLCHCWRHNQNQSWPYDQLQETNNTSYEEIKDSCTVIHPCNTRKDILKLIQLKQAAPCHQARFHILRNLTLRETLWLCTWTKRRLRTLQLLQKKAKKTRGRRLRRNLKTSSSDDLSPSMTTAQPNHPGVQSTAVSLSLSPYLLTGVEHSRSSSFDEISLRYSPSLDIQSLEGHVRTDSSLTNEIFRLQSQRTAATNNYSQLRDYGTGILTPEQNYVGTSSATVPPSNSTLSFFTFYTLESTMGGVVSDTAVKLINYTSIYGTSISIEKASDFHTSLALMYTKDDNWGTTDTLQKTLLTEGLHQNSPVTSFENVGSHGFRGEIYGNFVSEIPWLTSHSWDHIYTDSKMSSYISLATLDASFLQDGDQDEPSSFHNSLSYWHQSIFQTASPTSRTSLPVFNGVIRRSYITPTPSLSDEEITQSFREMSTSIYNLIHSDCSDHSTMSQESISESKGSGIIMQASGTVVVNKLTLASSVQSALCHLEELDCSSSPVDHRITGQVMPPTPYLSDEKMQASERNSLSTFKNQGGHSDSSHITLHMISDTVSYEQFSEASFSTLGLQSSESSVKTSVKTIQYSKPHEYDNDIQNVSGAESDTVILPSFLPEGMSVKTLVGYHLSTLNNPIHFSNPSPIFLESSSASVSFWRFLETSTHTSVLQSLASSVQTASFNQLNESDLNGQSMFNDHRSGIDQSMQPTSSLLDDPGGILLSTFTNHGDQSHSGLISLQIIGATASYELFLETSVQTINLLSLESQDQTVPFKLFKSDDSDQHVSDNNGNILSTLLTPSISDEKMQASMGNLWSTFMNQEENSDSRHSFSNKLSTSREYEVDCSFDAAQRSSGTTVTGDNIEKCSTLNFLGEFHHSTAGHSISAFIVSDVSLEPSTPILTEQLHVSYIHTVPLPQWYESVYGDQHFSFYDGINSKTLDASFKNTLEGSSDIQAMLTLDNNFHDKSINSALPSISDLFSLVSPHIMDWKNTMIHDSKMFVAHTTQEILHNADGQTAAVSMPPLQTHTDHTHSETLENQEPSEISLISLIGHSIASSFILHSEFHTQSNLNQTKPTIFKWLTTIPEEQNPPRSSTESSQDIATYPAAMVSTNSTLFETLQTSIINSSNTQYYQGSTSLHVAKTNNEQMLEINESPTSSQIIDILSLLDGPHVVQTLVDTNHQSGPTRYLSMSHETERPGSNMENQFSSFSSLEFSLESSRLSSLHSSQEVATEKFPLDDSQFISLLGHFSAQNPVSLPLEENTINDVYTPGMETRGSLNDCETVIDRPWVGALSYKATSCLVGMTGSNFDSAVNGIYTPSESVGSTFPHKSFHTPSSALQGTIHSKSETVSLSYYVSQGPQSSLNTDFSQMLFSLPSTLNRPSSLSSRSYDSGDQLKETISQTVDVSVSGAFKEIYIFSLESFREEATSTVSMLDQYMEGVTTEKSVSLPFLIESSQKHVFTSTEAFHFSHRVAVSSNEHTVDSQEFIRPDTHISVMQMQSFNVQQTLMSDNSGDANMDTASSKEFVWDTPTVSHPGKHVSRSFTESSLVENEHMIHSTLSMDLNSDLHHLSNSFHTVSLDLSTGSIPEMVKSEVYTSTQMSDETFVLLSRTIQLPESEMKTYNFLSSAKKSYLDGLTPSSLHTVAQLYFLRTTFSESLMNTVRSAAEPKDIAVSFSSAAFVRMNSDTLFGPFVFQSASSPLFSPSVRSIGLDTSTAYDLSPSLSTPSVRTTEFMKDLQKGLPTTTVTLIDSDSKTLRNDLHLPSSFGSHATLHRSRPVMTVPDRVTAVITLSHQDALNLSPVTKTIPLFTEESTAGREAMHTSLLPVSSALPLKQFTQQLQSPIITSFQVKDNHFFTSSATQTALLNEEPPLQLSGSRIISPPSLAPFLSSWQPSLMTVVLISAPTTLVADNTEFSMVSSSDTPPLPFPTPFTPALSTPPLPTTKIVGLAKSVHWSIATSSSFMTSSGVASSFPHISMARSHGVGPASQAITPPGLDQPNNTFVPSPSIQQEHLLEITLEVNRTVNIFVESFQTVIIRGLLLTFLQASQLNQTRARRSDSSITVKIFTLSRLSADSVLVQFSVLEDGHPMKATDVVRIFNRLPDLLGTLNDNIPFLVMKAPSAVAVSPVPEWDQLGYWIAAVVVLGAICIVLAALLGVFVKKMKEETGREARNIQKRVLTPFEEGQRHQSRVLASEGPSCDDAELGEARKKEPPMAAPYRGSDQQSMDQPAALLHPRTVPRGKRPIPGKKQKRKRRKSKNAIHHHQKVTAVEINSEDSSRNWDFREATPETRQTPQEPSASRHEGVAKTQAQHPLPQVTHTGPRFNSTVTPLPPLQPQKLTGHEVGDSAKAVEQKSAGNGTFTQSVYRQKKAQSLVHRDPGAIAVRDQQRQADRERLRNKKRLREKQRDRLRDAGSGPGNGHRDRAGEGEPGAKFRNKVGMSRRERDLAAWRRVQSQISSLLDPEPEEFNGSFRTTHPWSPGYFQGYMQPMSLESAPFGPLVGRGHPLYSAGQLKPSSSQLANNFSPWAQPWQKAPIPNTRHNAEFLHSLPIPSHSLIYPPPHPFFYPPPSGLPDSVVERGGSSATSKPQSSQHPISQNNEAAGSVHINSTPVYGDPVLSPSSKNYLKLLTSLSTTEAPHAEGKRKTKRSITKTESRTLQPTDKPLSETGPESES